MNYVGKKCNPYLSSWSGLANIKLLCIRIINVAEPFLSVFGLAWLWRDGPVLAPDLCPTVLWHSLLTLHLMSEARSYAPEKKASGAQGFAFWYTPWRLELRESGATQDPWRRQGDVLTLTFAREAFGFNKLWLRADWVVWTFWVWPGDSYRSGHEMSVVRNWGCLSEWLSLAHWCKTSASEWEKPPHRHTCRSFSDKSKNIPPWGMWVILSCHYTCPYTYG